MSIRSVARQLGLGRVAYLLWHLPRAEIARSRREGGPREQWRNFRGRKAMQAAAQALPPQPPPDAGAAEVYFLTGKRFWYQTAFCCWSLRRAAGINYAPVLIDDGTFDAPLHAEVARVFPGARVESCATIESRLDAHLPENRFPTLRRQRRTYLHLRKLTDVHAGMAGWRLVLDSDLLFFHRPTALIDWLAAPRQALHLTDVYDSYGYPATTLAALAAPHAMPERLNVGLLGLRSDALDWDQLEAWCAALLRRHGTSYYLEQALSALWVSRGAAVRLPAKDYRVMPDENECRAPVAVMHHYVDTSKRGYFRHAWQRALEMLSPA